MDRISLSILISFATVLACSGLSSSVSGMSRVTQRSNCAQVRTKQGGIPPKAREFVERPTAPMMSVVIYYVVLLITVGIAVWKGGQSRSEEHTSELQSLMRISYAVFCLKKQKTHQYTEQGRCS